MATDRQASRFPHLGASLLARSRRLLRDLGIKLLQHLEADATAAALPQLFSPSPRRPLFFRIRLVKGVDENVCINEDGRGHGPPRATSIGRSSSERASWPERAAWLLHNHPFPACALSKSPPGDAKRWSPFGLPPGVPTGRHFPPTSPLCFVSAFSQHKYVTDPVSIVSHCGAATILRFWAGFTRTVDLLEFRKAMRENSALFTGW
jgi:hypothetical protein